MPNPDVAPTTTAAAPPASGAVADPVEAGRVADSADESAADEFADEDAGDTPGVSADSPSRGDQGGRASATGHDSASANDGSQPARAAGVRS